MSKIDKDFCISSYLAFRYVMTDNIAWAPSIQPVFPKLEESKKTKVKNAENVIGALKEMMVPLAKTHETGILLSGGIDSAILASFFKKGTKAYTIRFIAEKNAID